MEIKPILSIALILLSSSSTAETFNATIFEDTNDGVCDSHCSLREAINAANALAGTDTIKLKAGDYQLSPNNGNFDEDTNTYGDLDITDNVIIMGKGVNNTIISGRGGRILEVQAENATFKKFSISNGSAFKHRLEYQNNYDEKDSQWQDISKGGGIYAHQNLTLQQMKLIGNCAVVSGSAVEIEGNLTVISTEFVSNTPCFSQSEFNNLSIQNTPMQNSVSTISLASNNLQKVTIRDSIIVSNHTYKMGSVIFANNTSLDIRRSSFFLNNNPTWSELPANSISPIVFSQTDGSVNAKAHIENSTFYKNNGFALTIATPAKYKNITVVENTGGIQHSESTAIISNSILMNNTFFDCDNSATPIVKNSIIPNQTTCQSDIPYDPNLDYNQVFENYIYDGENVYLPLKINSPAIDKANNCSTKDQIGNSRNIALTNAETPCDLGAVEKQL